MSQAKIDSIIKTEKNGHSGELNKIVNWLVPKKELARGFHLLMKEDSIHLNKLIEFNYEVKSLLLFELLRVESYITTRFDLLFKNNKLDAIDTTLFKNAVTYIAFNEFLSKKFGDKAKTKNIVEMFEDLTFGSKVSIIDMLNADCIKTHFLNEHQMSKFEFLKSLSLCVEIRNKVAHQPFIAYKGFIDSIVVIPKEKDNVSRLDYYYDRIEFINSIYGKKGFRDRVKKVSGKYKTYLKLTHIL